MLSQCPLKIPAAKQRLYRVWSFSHWWWPIQRDHEFVPSLGVMQFHPSLELKWTGCLFFNGQHRCSLRCLKSIIKVFFWAKKSITRVSFFDPLNSSNRGDWRAGVPKYSAGTFEKSKLTRNTQHRSFKKLVGPALVSHKTCSLLEAFLLESFQAN